VAASAYPRDVAVAMVGRATLGTTLFAVVVIELSLCLAYILRVILCPLIRPLIAELAVLRVVGSLHTPVFVDVVSGSKAALRIQAELRRYLAAVVLLALPELV
jgi:hypothetical protein